MNECVKYIELKSGYSDDGPAWIGRVKMSKSGRTVYFNGHAFRKKTGYFSNYVDIETGEQYWISGLKKDGCNRHWAGSGKIIIDQRVVEDYLRLTGEKRLKETLYTPAEMEDDFPVERIRRLLNTKEE